MVNSDQDELDSQLAPIIEKQIEKIQDQMTIRLGDKNLQYNDAFRFFISTNSSAPNYGPEIYVKMQIINFSISSSALEEQILAMIVSIENPNLEKRKQQLTDQLGEDRINLSEIENNILQIVSSQDDLQVILSDEHLINTLRSSQDTY